MGSELQAKFQRLAQEYAKVKSHADVLKEAVLTERNEGAKLKDDIREKEQAIHKMDQENEALQFRNQQLSKRVEVLQQEIDSVQRKKEKKTKGANLNVSSEYLNVQAGELKARINENERLQSQMDKLSQESSRSITLLQNQISELERKMASDAEDAKKLQQDQLSTIDKLEMQKALLQGKLERSNEELEEVYIKLENVKSSKVSEDVSDFSGERARALVVQSAVSGESGAFGFLDVPQFDTQVQSILSDVINDLEENVIAFMTHITNYFSYLEQRSNYYPIDGTTGQIISPVNKKFTQRLHEFAAECSHPLQNAFNKIIDVCKQGQVVVKDHILQEFGECCHKLTMFIDRVVPYHLLSLQEESRQTVCGESLEKKNSETTKVIASLPNKFKSIDSYISVLIASSQFKFPLPTVEAIYNKLSGCFAAICESIKEILSCYSTKIVQEHSLPTVSKNLQTTSECVLSSLTALNAASKKVSSILKNNSDTIVSVVMMRVSSSETASSDVIDVLRARACQYMRSFTPVTTGTVPYQLALHMAKSLHFASNDTESLTQQVKELKDVATRLEQDKEKWILEAQLMKIKYDREHQKIVKLEKQLSELHANPSAAIELAPPTQNDMIQQKSESPISDVDDDTAERDHAELIKNHYATRITELTSQLQDAEAKAGLYYSEYCVLYKQVQHYASGDEKMSKELKIVTYNQTKLQDELVTTKDNYETQISVMSDHICSLNETITKQRDEMELLKSTKGKKRRL
ncbi:protein phosphatase 1 regulatory subunit 21-like [Dysidea avara]|uniref:protein phosphatase 1 regulatory subunit 21-like n=1 Tax=Dysidea avara TaxID=196820 RepID=UPI0033347906